MASLAAVNAEFCFNLFREMDNNQGNGNVFFSSLSIFTALAVVRLGARGDGAAQMDKNMFSKCFPDQWCHLEDLLEMQMPLKQKPWGWIPAICVKQAPSVLTKVREPLLEWIRVLHTNTMSGHGDSSNTQEYIRCAEKLYNAKVERVDFTNAVEDARYKINNWVTNETHGKIKNIISEGSISSSVVMVLVNAVYFKGKWESAFPKSDTRHCRFKSPKCPGKAVAMMYQERMFNLSVIQDPRMQVLELRYQGGISMYIMLPQSENLSEIENQLTFENLMKWTSPRKMNHRYVKVFLPQFKIEKKYEIKRYLQALGLRDIFDETRADFSGIASGGRLSLSKLMHESYIEVNEDGTEAAAVSENTIVEKLLPESTVFKADHPFLFVIRKNDIILFSGKVSCP
ncbi:serpin B7 isoform X2 [Eptesicus fuscus]|uniref:serpin B7 isoform X2 n=1 Tax=Eptesicus fuscus TaxID=29078 RepID=UPI002403F8E5|nr:serpin B7 isoform X2 [Eptesicus fuscus]